MILSFPNGEDTMASSDFTEGVGPFELTLQRAPRISSEDGNVVVTLPVYAPRMIGNEIMVRVVLSVEQTDLLPAQIRRELKKVHYERQSGSKGIRKWFSIFPFRGRVN
jgi:hypothetical protein